MQSSFLGFNSCILLCEAGSRIGFGHLTRCSALAETLEFLGVTVSRILLANDFHPEGGWESLPWLENPTSVLQRVSGASVVVIDSYLAKPHHYQFFRENGLAVVAIDDFNRISYPADLIINPNVFVEQLDYSNQVAPVTGGKSFVILRKPFRELAHHKALPAIPKKLLVTLGGSDYRDVFPLIQSALTAFPDIEISAILPDRSQSTADFGSITYLSKQSARGMCEEMLKADIVISACGQTLHELAALGKATIGICLDIDQVPNRNYYLKEGFLDTQIDWDQPDLGVALVEAVRALFPKESRMHKKQLGPSLIDVNGVTNLAKLIHQRFFHAV